MRQKGTNMLDTYKGAILRAWDGEYTVLKSKQSEPDGYGGYLLDLTVEKGPKVTTWHNMHTKVIEGMMV
jgi:hypothetical protein